MAEEVAGKVFSTAEEAGVTPLSDEEMVAARKRAREARERWEAADAPDRDSVPDRFHDDLVGTEYEGWTPGGSPRG